MVLIIKRKLILTAEFLHLKIFGHEMSPAMKDFLKHLSWSFFGGFIAAGIMLILMILAGKKLGPDVFGQYNSLLSFATALTFIFLLGNDVSSVRYLSDRNYEKEKKKIFTTSFVIVLMQSIIFGAVVFLLSDFIIEKFSLQGDFLFLGIAFAFLLAFKSLFDGYLRAFNFIKKQSIIRVTDAMLAMFSFMFLYYYLQKTEYYFYVISISFGAVCFIALSSFFVFGNFGKFNLKSAKLLFNYNKFLILGSLGGFIMSLEKYFIGKYIGTYELGIFSAYHMASFLIVANMGAIFMNVFWPISVREKVNLKVISKKMNTLFLKGFLFWTIFSSFFISLTISFMGKEYPLNFLYVFLFAISSFVAFAFSVLISLLNIDRIKESIVISFFCYFSLLIVIILFRNILCYLVGQILIYLVFYLVSQKRLKASFIKKVNLA